MCLYVQDESRSRCALDKWGMGRDDRDRDPTPDDSTPTSRACLEFHHLLEIGKHAREVDLHPRKLARVLMKLQRPAQYAVVRLSTCDRGRRGDLTVCTLQNLSELSELHHNHRKSDLRNSSCLSMLLQPRRSGSSGQPVAAGCQCKEQ